MNVGQRVAVSYLGGKPLIGTVAELVPVAGGRIAAKVTDDNSGGDWRWFDVDQLTPIDEKVGTTEEQHP